MVFAAVAKTFLVFVTTSSGWYLIPRVLRTVVRLAFRDDGAKRPKAGKYLLSGV